jgi:hypothetical protein
MHHLHISIAHQGLDTVGGLIIDGEPIDLTDYMEHAADQFCQSFVALASLNLEDTVPPFNQEMLEALLDEWRESNKHHDQAYNVDYISTIANTIIAFRNCRTGS